MILLVNEELGVKFPFVSIEEFMLMLFNHAKTLPTDFDTNRELNQ